MQTFKPQNKPEYWEGEDGRKWTRAALFKVGPNKAGKKQPVTHYTEEKLRRKAVELPHRFRYDEKTQVLWLYGRVYDIIIKHFRNHII